MTGALNNAVNLNDFSANDVKYKVGFDNKDVITRTFKFVISWQAAKKWMSSKPADALVEFSNKSGGIGRTIIRNPVED
ncbi:MAG: hypothetical protein A2V86_02585 [Deltaproteobacteria bacterium RBG_16_49_23]|nr:MAG: hypothetical protein A2V86_02585 [Deltaproteobacteria bacterium RBG_16_49_23]